MSGRWAAKCAAMRYGAILCRYCALQTDARLRGARRAGFAVAQYGSSTKGRGSERASTSRWRASGEMVAGSLLPSAGVWAVAPASGAVGTMAAAGGAGGEVTPQAREPV